MKGNIMPNKHGIDFLLALNKQNSEEFVAVQEKRRLHRKEHGTEIAVLKCMDGRLNLSVMTRAPLGLLQPFRNLGGIFDLAWPHFQSVMDNWKKYADSKNRDTLVLVTYHFSRGSEHRGCAGHKYNLNKAREAAFELSKDFREYSAREVQSGKTATQLFAIPIGIETDYESLILHGEDGEVQDLLNVDSSSGEEDIKNLLIGLYPSIFAKAPNVINDIVPLVVGNIGHVGEIKESGRLPQEADHKESVLAIGRGFDWLHLPNRALIVGPWQNNLAEPIGVAVGLIQKNLRAGVLNDNKIVLLTSGVYREPGGEQFLAERKSLYLRDIALGVIRKDFEELLPRLQILATTVDLQTRRLNIVE